MAEAVEQRLFGLLTRAGLRRDDGWDLLGQLRRGREPKEAKTEFYSITLLHYACEHGWRDFVTFLIEEHNCDPHSNTWHRMTPLHYACRYGHFGIVRYLICEQHCDPDCCDNDQRTPLHWVVGANAHKKRRWKL